MVPNAQPKGGSPVGRRVVLGMFGLGAAGVFFGSVVSRGVQDALSAIGSGGNSVAGLLPGGGYFQLYTVTGGFPVPPPRYSLTVDGLVKRPLSLTVADLEAMPAEDLVRPFQCVTGWRVNSVQWTGVRLGHLLDEAGVEPSAAALRFFSFDGVYTEFFQVVDFFNDAEEGASIFDRSQLSEAPNVHFVND